MRQEYAVCRRLEDFFDDIDYSRRETSRNVAKSRLPRKYKMNGWLMDTLEFP